MKITVFGSGGWGTAIALLLHHNGHAVTLWSAFSREAEEICRLGENPLLRGIAIPKDIMVTSDILEGSETELAVIATPSFAVRETARRLRSVIKKGTIVVSVSKGIERESSMTFSRVIAEELGDGYPVAVLSGPSHAEEVGRQIPTACVAASSEPETAELVQDVFMNSRFRVYVSGDVLGVELGGALKNVIALCAGVCDGMGFGDNTIAMLMTRGLAEMSGLVMAMGGRRETLAGLSGVGDLIVTCTSRHSRNRRAGVLLGKGMTAEEAMQEVGATVEGYYAAKAAMELAGKAGVEMPISRGIYQVMYEGKQPEEVIFDLMNRDKKREI